MLHALLAALLLLPVEANVTVIANTEMFETSLVASGNDVVLAVMRRRADFTNEIEVFSSPDAGATWPGHIVVPLTIDGVAYNHPSDPSLAALDDGSIGLLFLVVDTTEAERFPPFAHSGIAFSRSMDGGATWSPPQMLVSRSKEEKRFDDKPTLYAGRGAVYAAWTAVAGSDTVVIATSSDRGAHWSEPHGVTQGNESIAQLAPLSDGTFVLLTVDQHRGRYLMRISTDGGTTFSVPKELAAAEPVYATSPRTLTESPPVATMIARGAEVYCIFPAADGVYFTASRDGGANWSVPARLAGENGDAVLPVLAIDADVLTVGWLDSRDDPASKTLSLYATRSFDGGRTFAAPHSFSSPFPAGGRLGDYNGMAKPVNGAAVTAFVNADGVLSAARIVFELTHRRAARH